VPSAIEDPVNYRAVGPTRDRRTVTAVTRAIAARTATDLCAPFVDASFRASSRARRERGVSNDPARTP
jgi:hypothetical protein